MKDELSKIERTRLSLWALSEAEARVTTAPHIEAEVMRAWDAMQAERARVAAVSHASEPRFVASVAKWVLVPAMAAGMAWVALRSVMPVSHSPVPDAATAASAAGTPSGTWVVELPAAPAVPASPLAVEPHVHTGERLGAPASVPSQRSGAATAAGTTTAVVFVGELVGAGERIQVVRMRVPRSTLASLGVSVAEGSETVFVDLLVGEDGVARALQVEM